MLIYIFVFIIILFSYYIFPPSRTNQKYVIAIIAIILISLAGFREVGIDHDSVAYKEAWNSLRNGILVGIDPTFILLVKVLPSFSVLLIFYAILGVFLKTLAAIKLSPLPILSLLLYYSHFYFLHEITQIRVGVATGFLLLELYYIVRNQKYKALGCLLMAGVFHMSACIGVIFFLFKSDKNNLHKYVNIFIISLILCISNISILNLLSLIRLGGLANKIQLYIQLLEIGQQAEIHVFNVAFFLQVVIGLLSMKICKLKLGNQYTLLITKIYWIGLILYLLFSNLPVFAFRLSELCLVGEYILIPQIVFLFRPRYLSRSITVILAVCIFSLYVLVLNTVDPYRSSICL